MIGSGDTCCESFLRSLTRYEEVAEADVHVLFYIFVAFHQAPT
jgi:hypothetical protein